VIKILLMLMEIELAINMSANFDMSFVKVLCFWENVGVIPNRYTSDVVLNQQARVAHQGGMADSPYRAAQLLKPA
jgi:hypothetical protein